MNQNGVWMTVTDLVERVWLHVRSFEAQHYTPCGAVPEVLKVPVPGICSPNEDITLQCVREHPCGGCAHSVVIPNVSLPVTETEIGRSIPLVYIPAPPEAISTHLLKGIRLRI